MVGTDRMTGEAWGVALTVLCAGIGVIAKIIEHRIEEGGLPASLGEALRR